LKKKAFTLSINMLVILILAFAMLAVGLIFINKIRTIEVPEVPQKCEIYPPSSDAPICINRNIDLKKGSEVSIPISFYNDESEDISSEVIPKITCSKSVDDAEIDLKTTAAGSSIATGDVGEYKLIVKVEKTTAAGMYPCTLTISETQKSFTFTIG
jgi:hypothetical protein